MVDWVKYRLLDESGGDLGILLSQDAAWTAGDVVHRGPGASYTVVSVVDAEADDDVHTYLVVSANP